MMEPALTVSGLSDGDLVRAEASRRDALETLAAAERGEFGKLLSDRWSPGVTLVDGRNPVGGRDVLVRGMEGDLEAEHCPPAVAWVMSLEDGRISQLRLFHSGRA
jgi:RNA polymerase sigma-70 factor (ECF subfamily)